MRLVVAVFLMSMLAGCGNGEASRVASESQQWALPDRLREISGLALTPDQRLLAVDDEVGVVYELDYDNGGLVKAFAFGDPVIKGDFEGIAVLSGLVWLMTSNGDLYAAPEGGDGDHVAVERFETGLGKDCELEGLAEQPDEGVLMLLCKNGRDRKKLRVYEWHPENEVVSETRLPEKAVEKALGVKRIRPSGLAIDPVSNNRVILTGLQHAIFEMDRGGALIDVIMRLDTDRHRQAEGIAITGDGRLLIADEGGKGRARLAVYRMDNGE